MVQLLFRMRSAFAFGASWPAARAIEAITIVAPSHKPVLTNGNLMTREFYQIFAGSDLERLERFGRK